MKIEIKPIYKSQADLTHLPHTVQEFIEEKSKICQPDSIHVCDGTEEEYKWLLKTLQDAGWIQKLEHMNNWYYIHC